MTSSLGHADRHPVWTEGSYTVQLTVFGGTGPTGQLLIERACHDGHDIVAFARTPAKLPAHQRLSVVEGQLVDAAAIAETIDGADADAVLSVLAPGTTAADIPPLITGYRNIVAAMDRSGVRRLVALGTPSIPHPDDGKDRKVALMVQAIKTFQPTAYDALVTIGAIVSESDLDWTIVRAPLLTNGALTSSINVRLPGVKGGIRLSRANAAGFILGQATDSTYYRKAPYISDT